MPSVPIHFPKEIINALTGLSERRLLTPSSLTAITMGPILPKQFTGRIKKQALHPLTQDNLYDSLFLRKMKTINEDNPRASYTLKEYDNFDRQYKKLLKTHTLHLSHVDGIERLELRAIKTSTKYAIYFPGNYTDAMYIDNLLSRSGAKNFAQTNHVFWNYPGVETQDTFSLSVHDMIAPGLEQVQMLLNQGVLAQDITLYARSIGGGVAAQVMKRIGRTEYKPNLFIDRSFASIDAMALAMANGLLLEIPQKWRVLSTSLMSFSLIGVCLGFIVSGAVATLGVFCATLIAGASYILAHMIQIVRAGVALLPYTEGAVSALDQFTLFMHNNVSQFAVLVQNKIFNGLATLIGGVVTLVGLIAGGILGLIIGGILSLPGFSVFYPANDCLLQKMLQLTTVVAHIQMDSVSAIHDIFAQTTNPPKISSINTKNDDVIPSEAALNTGCNYGPDENTIDLHSSVLSKMSFYWYRRGGHNLELQDLYRHQDCSR